MGVFSLLFLVPAGARAHVVDIKIHLLWISVLGINSSSLYLSLYSLLDPRMCNDLHTEAYMRV